MATTRPTMAARLAALAALLAQLQLAAASFYTVTSYFALSPSVSTYSTRSYTYTETITLNPTFTPTATPVSTRTYTDSFDDVEVVSIFVPASALPSSELNEASNALGATGVYTEFAVAVTWTAPSSCPTPFTVVTATDVYVPYDVKPHMSAHSTATSVYTGSTYTRTYLTYFLDATQVPSTERGNPTTDYYYSYYVASCRNPTATGAAYWGPSSGGGSSGGSSSGDSWDDWEACSYLTGCVRLRTWVIVVATILPSIFLLGFVESYFWFRRMMLGKSALRLGTICWCLLSLWFICLTRSSPARSKEDQVLLKQYWATLGFGTRVKYWLKHGLRWRYPVELLGDPKGNNPPVVMMVPQPIGGVPGQGPQGDGAAGGEGGEKMQGGVNVQQQPVYMPYPAQAYMQPLPGQSYPVQQYPGQPGFQPPPQGYVMVPVPPQGVYPGQQQPGFMPAPPMGDGQQLHPPYVPSPSPVHTGTTEVPSMQPTPPPPGTTELPSAQAGHEQQHQAPPPGQQPPH